MSRPRRGRLQASGSEPRIYEVLERAQWLFQQAVAILLKSVEDGDTRTALAAVREAARTLEVLLRTLERLEDAVKDTESTAAIQEWAHLRERLTAVLEAYPEARTAVINALKEGRL